MKTILTITLLLSLTTLAFGQTDVTYKTGTITQSGIGLGSIIAVVASWDRNRSIMWAILHGILGWIYVLYFVVTRSKYEEDDED